MNIPKRGHLAASHLDAIRAVAALAVLAGHLRALTLVDWNAVRSKSAPLRALYFLTGLHHQAVMAFFVLSGFFISGSVVRGLQAGRWNGRKYATARLVRLYVALIPALLLGVALDRTGLALFSDGGIYRSGYGHMIPTNVGQTLGPLDLLRNLGFLQTIQGPVVGTNGPLWSLANEFWYYVAFPLLALALAPGPAGRRIACLLGGLAVLALIGPIRVLYFGVWLLGFGVASAPSTRLSRSGAFGVLCWCAFLASLVASRAAVLSDTASDLAIALSFALALWSLVSREPREAREGYRRVAEFWAGFSYTLYLVHVPFLVLATAYLFGRSGPLQPTAAHLALVLAMGAVTVGYAILVWSFGERNTDRLRAWFDRRFSPAEA